MIVTCNCGITRLYSFPSSYVVHAQAVCRPPDQFNKVKGRKVALKKVLEAAFPGDEGKACRTAIWKDYFRQTGANYGKQAEDQTAAV